MTTELRSLCDTAFHAAGKGDLRAMAIPRERLAGAVAGVDVVDVDGSEIACILVRREKVGERHPGGSEPRRRLFYDIYGPRYDNGDSAVGRYSFWNCNPAENTPDHTCEEPARAVASAALMLIALEVHRAVDAAAGYRGAAAGVVCRAAEVRQGPSAPTLRRRKRHANANA
jgi:hypothetical protein